MDAGRWNIGPGEVPFGWPLGVRISVRPETATVPKNFGFAAARKKHDLRGDPETYEKAPLRRIVLGARGSGECRTHFIRSAGHRWLRLARGSALSYQHRKSKRCSRLSHSAGG